MVSLEVTNFVEQSDQPVGVLQRLRLVITRVVVWKADILLLFHKIETSRYFH
jgi:hypothetical protein